MHGKRPSLLAHRARGIAFLHPRREACARGFPRSTTLVAQEVTRFLGFEDEVVIGYIENKLTEAKVSPKEMQISLMSFLEKVL